jgi:lipopolysaccharide/colanic/teichoic acid biosynthesis glycosyltransferase
MLLAAAAAVKAGSPGPVFFRQARVGRDGKIFRIWKFRTMRHNPVPEGPAVTADGDPRVTAQGRWLRRWKIDELPQLINVLAGEMSVVGPRPEVPRYADRWPAVLRGTILSVRPGLTDPATLLFWREEDLLARAEDPEGLYLQQILPAKAAAYADYARTRTFLGDLRILLATLGALVGKNRIQQPNLAQP